MDTWLSVLKATQFVKHLLSIYYAPSATPSVCGSEMNKIEILAPRGLLSNRRDIATQLHNIVICPTIEPGTTSYGKIKEENFAQLGV